MELRESATECHVALVRGREEGVVRGHLPRGFPDSLDGHELRRVAGKAMQFDEVGVVVQPLLSLVVEVMAGCVVDNEEDFAWRMPAHEAPQELAESGAVEDWREPVREAGFIEGNGTEQVRGFAQSIGIDAGLDTHARPGAMETAVLPEARFVLENYNSATGPRFFLIRGNRSRSQIAWASALARARRLRGRCTENPS